MAGACLAGNLSDQVDMDSGGASCSKRGRNRPSERHRTSLRSSVSPII